LGQEVYAVFNRCFWRFLLLELAALCLLAGAFAGFLAGLFGVGGGLLLVPVLVTVFASQQFDSTIHMQLALGTSLATIMVNGLSSVLAHHRKGAVDWLVVKQLVPGLVLGALIGAQFASAIPSHLLKTAFGIGELLVAARLWLASQPKPSRSLPGPWGMGLAGSVIGSISAMAGIGGGTLTVPYLTWCNVAMQRAVAVSAACGLPIALAGASGYVFAGWQSAALPDWTTGYIYWPAALAIMATGIFMAPVGAKLAHYWPPAKLKKAFAVLLTVLGIRMLLF
jgi:uncharacterized membrane protein YfcA